MGKIINAAQYIIEKTGVAVTLIHHPGKDAARGPRGSYSLTCDVNSVFEVQKVNETLIELKNTKQKNFEGVKSLFFNLKSVEIGRSVEGKRVVGSVTVQASAPRAITSKARVGSARYAAEKAIFGGTINGSIGYSEARKNFDVEYQPKSDATPDAYRKGFQRIIDKLKKEGRIECDGKTIRIIGGGVAGVFSPITAAGATAD